jgi:two-component system chemotaxis response regulator CheB
MANIRVLVVEDSFTVRKRICATLASHPEFDIVGEARDGKTAIELCLALRPDVVTMDMMLPVMSGLSATEYIMAFCPTPILIVSSSTNRGDLFKTYDALAAGAVDVLEKPDGEESDDAWNRRFVAAVRLVSRIRVITHPRARLDLRSVRQPVRPGPAAEKPTQIVAIGASTGGPGALIDIFRELPRDFPFPILLVQHISELLGMAFAEWLTAQTGTSVSFAEDGEPISGVAGRVVMAPPGRHLAVSDGRLILSDGPERNSCRPSVDVLFESLARDYGSAVVACLLTGMGRDGAAGLLSIRRAGGMTVAQDEASCVVYGMPREAVLLGAAERVLPLTEIGPALAALAAPAMKRVGL